MFKTFTLTACFILTGVATASAQSPKHTINEAMLLRSLDSLGYTPKLITRIDAGTRHVIEHYDSELKVGWKIVIEHTNDNYIRLRSTYTVAFNVSDLSPAMAARIREFAKETTFTPGEISVQTAPSSIEVSGPKSLTAVTPLMNTGLSAAHIREAIKKHALVVHLKFLPLLDEAKASTRKAS